MTETNGQPVQEDRYLVPGLVRGVEILRLFNRDRPVIGPPEIARELGIPRSTVFRLAQTLEFLGLLERTEGGRGYRLGIGLLSLGFEYLASMDIADMAGPHLDALRDETGLSSHLVVRDGAEVVVVRRASGTSAFASSLSVGTRLPAHGTVLGRVLLADLDREELRALYGDGALPAFTAQTPATLDELEALLNQDRKRGYAMSDGYFEQGISSAAMPVRDARGRAIAAVNVTVPSGGDRRLDARLIANLRDTVDTLSTALSYKPAQGDAA